MYEYRATVLRVHDGDTVVLDVDLGFRNHIVEMPIRILGINAPELATPAGKEAAAFAQELLPPGTVVMLSSDKDRADKYGGRWLGELALPDGRDFGGVMVHTGHALPWDGKGAKPV